MKKMKAAVSALCAAAVIAGGAINALADDIKVIVNGADVKFDQTPVIQEGRTLVPMRAIFEALGATVEWEAASQKVTAKAGATVITMNINNVTMRVTESAAGTKNIPLDVPPQIIGDRTMVPVRAISEALGANVAWNGDTRTVWVSSVSHLKNMPYDDGRLGGAAKGNLSIENHNVKLSVDKSKASTEADAVSYVEYDIGGKFAYFAADVTGISNTSMRIYADGNLVYTSPSSFSKGGLPVPVTADITGAQKIRIEAYGVPGTPAGYLVMSNARVIGEMMH